MCTVCDGGFYSELPGAEACTACSAGKVQPKNGSSSCELCAVGRSQSSTGQTSCKECIAGTMSATEGSTSCRACEAGRYQSSRGSTDCDACTLGRYGPSTGLQSCLACIPGYYASKPGSLSCAPCVKPEGAWTLKPGTANCSDCKDKYYKDPFTTKCKKCNKDLAVCENGTTLFTIDVKHGFYRFQNKSVAIYACPFPDNCLGGTSTGKASCRAGSFGALCELCEDEHYLEGDSNTCEPCADATKGSSVMTLFIIAGVMGVLAIVVGGLMLYNAQRLSDFYARNEERILQLSAKITALIVTMQIIVLVNENHRDLEGEMLPQPYGKFLDSLSFLALDMVEFVPLSCLFGRVGHFETLMVWTVGPLSGIAVVSVLILLSKHEQRKTLREYTCFGVILILPLISRAVLQTFRCVPYDEGDPYVDTKKFLFVDPMVDCNGAFYESMRTYAIVMTIIWPVGVPIALIIWLSRLSQHLDPPNVIEEDAIELRKKNPFIVGSSIAFVALEHRPRYWYYEVVFNLQRRLVLT